MGLENSQGVGGFSQDQIDNYSQNQTTNQWKDELEDDPPVRGTRSLPDIHQRCNVAIYEPAGHEEALKDSQWKKAMEEEMSMI